MKQPDNFVTMPDTIKLLLLKSKKNWLRAELDTKQNRITLERFESLLKDTKNCYYVHTEYFDENLRDSELRVSWVFRINGKSHKGRLYVAL